MKKGFTLVELLVVIAIVAILAVSVVVVMNPAEMMKQARDSTRLSDLAAINSAIALALADVPNLGWNSSSTCTSGITGCTDITSTTAVDGTGWVPVKLSDVSGGSPLSVLPLDPSNGSAACDKAPAGSGIATTTCFYGFISDALGYYKILAKMESERYQEGGGSDVESTDGGVYSNIYEVGNRMTLPY